MLSVAPSSPPPVTHVSALHPLAHSHSHSLSPAHERNLSHLSTPLAPSSSTAVRHLTPETSPPAPVLHGQANATPGPSSGFLTLSTHVGVKTQEDLESVAVCTATTSVPNVGASNPTLSGAKVTATAGVEGNPVERFLASQLAHLASQHQSSEYSRSKLINRQLPNIPRYVPISLLNPVFVRSLRQMQVELSQEVAWHLSDRDRGGLLSSSQKECGGAMERESHDGAGVVVMSDVRKDIKNALEEQIPSASAAADGATTSASHPIHISSIIPMSSIPLLTLFLEQNTSQSPHILRLPDHWLLHRIVLAPFHGPSTGSVVPQTSSWPKMPVMWSQPGSSELLQNALNTELTLRNHPPSPYQTHSRRTSHASPLHLQERQIPLPPPTPPTLPQTPLPPSPHKRVHRRQTRRETTHGRASSAPPSIHGQTILRRPASFKELRPGAGVNGVSARAKSYPEAPKADLQPAALFVPSSHGIKSHTEIEGAIKTESRLGASGGSTRQIVRAQSEIVGVVQTALQVDMDVDQPVINPRVSSDKPVVQRLGNFFLSSCPGKKVRLQGPVKGRGAICRDVRADMLRVRDLGVKCIICCLDDSELEFLGASWSEYWAVANDLGLDVLRIPVPEGLAPLSAKLLNEHLTRVIEQYTLRGTPVLAHCRGGVGRAGLVACCWMLKLGLCGWRDEALCEKSCGPGCLTKMRREPPRLKDGKPMPEPKVCCATLQLLENVIRVLRQRRSLKAIETYEQVRFLLDFIDHLEDSARSSSRESEDLPPRESPAILAQEPPL